MKIAEMIDKDFIISDLTATTKREVLQELSRVLPPELFPERQDEVVNILLEREKLGSTGIGDGIAIPHGKIGGLSRIVMTFGRSGRGIDFNSMDGKPVNLFFLLMAPENSAGQHLKALAKISRMLKDDQFRKNLADASDTDELHQVILRKDEETY
jgi:PTS system nitrogen regulatory IIA component